jgi:glycosyltransferase involved in cell wall biosynthesis
LLNYQYPPLAEKLTKVLLSRSWVQVFGAGEYQGMMEKYSIPPERIELNEFGIDTSFWTPGGRKGGNGQYILAVGNCGRRDYDLLIKVAERMGGHFKIVSSQKPRCEIPPNVELVRDRSFFWEEISDIELRELYRGALCVVVPLIQTQQPSGQSVSLQAMACGTPVILTTTPGLWSRNLLVSWKNIVLVDVGNADQLEEAIKQLQRDNQLRCDIAKRAYELVYSAWTIDKFSERVVQMMHRVQNSV